MAFFGDLDEVIIQCWRREHHGHSVIVDGAR